ncbi:MAG: hypothetical protein QXY62_05825, partial [Candidatus Altiarchaeota archaeon]
SFVGCEATESFCVGVEVLAILLIVGVFIWSFVGCEATESFCVGVDDEADKLDILPVDFVLITELEIDRLGTLADDEAIELMLKLLSNAKAYSESERSKDKINIIEVDLINIAFNDSRFIFIIHV